MDLVKRIKFEDAVKETKELTSVVLRTGFRPRKKLRSSRPRSESEQVALCKSIVHATVEAERTGYIVKTTRGYKMNFDIPKIDEEAQK